VLIEVLRELANSEITWVKSTLQKETETKISLFLFFGFRLTIQNTANRHVSNAFDLIAVFISFSWRAAAGAPADFCCCCCAVAADFCCWTRALARAPAPLA
jgi:hypothetical protein